MQAYLDELRRFLYLPILRDRVVENIQDHWLEFEASLGLLLLLVLCVPVLWYVWPKCRYWFYYLKFTRQQWEYEIRKGLRMSRRKHDEYVEDLIVTCFENEVYEGRMTSKQKRHYYRLLADAFQLPGLWPPRHMHPDAVKAKIRERIPTYKGSKPVSFPGDEPVKVVTKRRGLIVTQV